MRMTGRSPSRRPDRTSLNRDRQRNDETGRQTPNNTELTTTQTFASDAVVLDKTNLLSALFSGLAALQFALGD